MKFKQLQWKHVLVWLIACSTLLVISFSINSYFERPDLSYQTQALLQLQRDDIALIQVVSSSIQDSATTMEMLEQRILQLEQQHIQLPQLPEYSEYPDLPPFPEFDTEEIASGQKRFWLHRLIFFWK